MKRIPPPSLWPAEVRNLFWDSDPEAIRPGRHRAFIMQRILEAGGHAALGWLRETVTEDELKRHIEGRAGRGLSPRRLRYFELILNLKNSQVTAWIRRRGLTPVPGGRPRCR